MKKLNYWGIFGLSTLMLFLGAQVQSQDGTSTYEKVQVGPTGVTVRTTYVVGAGSDPLAVGDPYGNGPLSAKAEAGPPSTQQSYSADCQDPRCIRAQKRQMSSPYWKK